MTLIEFINNLVKEAKYVGREAEYVGWFSKLSDTQKNMPLTLNQMDNLGDVNFRSIIRDDSINDDINNPYKISFEQAMGIPYTIMIPSIFKFIGPGQLNGEQILGLCADSPNFCMEYKILINTKVVGKHPDQLTPQEVLALSHDEKINLSAEYVTRLIGSDANMFTIQQARNLSSEERRCLRETNDVQQVLILQNKRLGTKLKAVTSNNNNKSTIMKLEELLLPHLDAHYNAEKPLKILIHGTNYSDGIGDFVHFFDFYKFFKEKYKNQPNIIVNGICTCQEDNYEVIKKIYGHEFPTDYYELNKENFYGQNRDSAELSTSFCILNISQAPSPYTMITAQKYINQYDAIINVSLPIFGLPILNLMRIKPEVFMQSILEYGGGEQEQKKYGDSYDQKQQRAIARRIYDEMVMGITDREAGIKIDKNINHYASLDEAKKAELLAYLQNQDLKKCLTVNLSSDQNYLSDHWLGCGYLQSREETEKFILGNVILSTKLNIDLFVNINFFAESGIPRDLVRQLENAQVCQIELIDNAGKKINDLGIFEQDGSGKILRLFQFAGTSEADKKILLSLSDVVAASGDTSLSEMISTKQLPFFALQSWKDRFRHAVIKELGKTDPKPNELIDYVNNFSLKNNDDFIRTMIYAKNNYGKILEQWKVYCDSVLAHHNVANTLNNMMDNVLISSIFKNGNEEEINKILTLIPEWKRNDTNFIFIAVNNHCQKALSLMQKKNLTQFNKLMQEKHPSSDCSPFQLAMMNNDVKMIAFMIENSMIASSAKIDFIKAIIADDVAYIRHAFSSANEEAEKKFLMGEDSLIEVALMAKATQCLDYLLPFIKNDLAEINRHYFRAAMDGNISDIHFICERVNQPLDNSALCLLEVMVRNDIQKGLDFLNSNLLELICDNKIITNAIKNGLAEMVENNYSPSFYKKPMLDKTEIQLINQGMLSILSKYSTGTLFDGSLSTNHDVIKIVEIDKLHVRNVVNNIFQLIKNQYEAKHSAQSNKKQIT